MTSEQMNEWVAYYQVEPFGDQWLQTGTLAAVIYNTLANIAASFGGQKLQRKDMREPTDFMPIETNTRRKGNTVAEQMAVIRTTIGM